MKKEFNCIVMGAAGRDFHVYLSFLRGNEIFRVKAFTATQIPFIDERGFPQSLAGPGYDEDIPIFDESELPELIDRYAIDFVFFAYSDVPHADIMHKASLVQAAGASFVMTGPDHTQLPSKKPVVSITATRTGAGKSPLTQWLARLLTDKGKRVAVIRHPMPYGNLEMQRVQRFASTEDLVKHECTIEEREEYEPYVDMGIPIYAGVDYQAILEESSKEADIVLWDGGNNDFSFIKPDLDIVVVDSLRAGHEIDYYPGEVNFRRADVLVIGKVGSAESGAVDGILERAQALNPAASLCTSDLEIDVDQPGLIKGQRVLVIEDGPTVTHGGMSFGAGTVAAERYGAIAVDPRPYVAGTIRDTFESYPHMERILPAMGYSEAQRDSLAQTINDCCAAQDVACVIDASPARLDLMLDLEVPLVRVTYRFVQKSGEPLENLVIGLL
ncbi:MAG: GTPase [Gammaproteobacteria bacterium]|jgi:predicted GTPase|nr:GTPase [Gammaproteobacteria bacterium]